MNLRLASLYQIITRVSSIGVNTIIFIVAARHDAQNFAQIAYFLSLIAVVSLLGGFGFQASLTQFPQKLKKEIYSNAWLVDNLFIKAPISVLLYLACSPISLYLNVEPFIVKTIALLLFVTSLENYAYIYFTKELLFFNRFVLEISRPVSIAIIYVIMTLRGHNALEAIGYAHIVGYTVRSLLSYMIFMEFPRLYYKAKLVKSLWRKGSIIYFSNWLKLSYESIDKLLFPVLLSVDQFGIYAISTKIPSVIRTLLSSISQKVLYPALRTRGLTSISRLKRLNEYSIEVLSLSGLIMGIIYVDFEKLSFLLFGGEYELIGEVYYLIGVAIFMRLASFQIMVFIRSEGGLKAELFVNMVSLTVLLSLMSGMSIFGIKGIAVSLVLSEAVLLLLLFKLQKKLVALQIKVVSLILSIVVLSLSFVEFISLYIASNYFLELIIFSMVYFGLYKLGSMAIKIFFKKEALI